MPILSVLSPSIADRVAVEREPAPDFFVDLNLDQIIAAITAGKDEYDLTPFFHEPLHDIDAITRRQDVMRDLENIHLFEVVKGFAKNMSAMRECIAQARNLHNKIQKERWFLDAINIYCDAIILLSDNLSITKLTSRGLTEFRDYVTQYATSERFRTLSEQTKTLTADLSAIRYSILIKGSRVEVRHYGGETDYSTEIQAVFERFRQGTVKEYNFNFTENTSMNHIEEKILDFVAEIHRDIFLRLEKHITLNNDYVDSTISIFDREIQFCIAYLEYISNFKDTGLPFCYPHIVHESKQVHDCQGFDLALAGKLLSEGSTVVCNDFHLEKRERIIVVSGPNQGGKTTFARTFGQLHYLASLGCPVPGRQAQLFLFDQIFTHFEREEDIGNLRGKLQDDLLRVCHIFERATPDSIIIMNEIFTSTTLRDAIVLSKKIAAKIMALDLLCVWVTFVEELAVLGEQTVSMVSTVVPENPAQRTHKIIRRPADGRAYAMSIAEKYRLTYPQIKERLRP